MFYLCVMYLQCMVAHSGNYRDIRVPQAPFSHWLWLCDLWKQLNPRFNSFFYKMGRYTTIYTSILISRAFLGLNDKGCYLICNRKLCSTSRSLHMLLWKHYLSSLHLLFLSGINSGGNSSGPAAFQSDLGALPQPTSRFWD